MQINKIFKSSIVIAFSLALPFSLLWGASSLPRPTNTTTLNTSNNITTNSVQTISDAKINTVGTKYWGTKQFNTLNTIHKDGVLVNLGGNNEGMITLVSMTDPTTFIPDPANPKSNIYKGGPYEFVLYDRSNGQINSEFSLVQNGNPFQITANQYLLDYFINGHYFYAIVMNGLQKVEFNCFNLNTGVRDDSKSFEYALDVPLRYGNTRSNDTIHAKTLFVANGQSYENSDIYFLAATGDLNGSEKIKIYAFNIAKPLTPLIAASEYAPLPFNSLPNSNSLIPCGLVEYNGEIVVYLYTWNYYNISTITFGFDPKHFNAINYKATWRDGSDPSPISMQPKDQQINWGFLNDPDKSSNQIRTFIIPINKTEFYSFMYFDNPNGSHSQRADMQTPAENWLIMTKLDSTRPEKWNGDYGVDNPGYYHWISLNVLPGESTTVTTHKYSTISHTDDTLYIEEVAGKDNGGADNYKIYEIPVTSKGSKNMTTLDDIFASESEIANGTKYTINNSPKDYLYSTVVPISGSFENTVAKPEMIVTDTGGAIIFDVDTVGSNVVNEYQIGKTTKSYRNIDDNNKYSNLVATFYNYKNGNKVPDFDDVLDGDVFNKTITYNKFNKEYSRNGNLTKVQTTFQNRLSEANDSFKDSVNVKMSNTNVKSKDFFTGSVDFSYKVTGASAWTNRGVYDQKLNLSHNVFMFDWVVTGSIIAVVALLIILSSLTGFIIHKKKSKRRKSSRSARKQSNYMQLNDARSTSGSSRSSRSTPLRLANSNEYYDDNYDEYYDDNYDADNHDDDNYDADNHDDDNYKDDNYDGDSNDGDYNSGNKDNGYDEDGYHTPEPRNPKNKRKR